MPSDMTDEELLELAAAALDHAHPVPDDAVAAAKAAFGLGSIDAHLALLVYDSLHDEPRVVLRADDDRHRSLAFEAGPVVIEIELLDDRRTVVGQIDPPQTIEVVIETPDGRSSVRTDDLGRFRSELTPGPFRICLTTPDSPTVTPWITS